MRVMGGVYLMRQEIELEADPKRIKSLMKKKSILLASLEYFYDKIKKETGITPSIDEVNTEHKKSRKKTLNKNKTKK